MKTIIVLMTCIFSCLTLTSFTDVETKITDLSGEWKLTIDMKIDGRVSENLGCSLLEIEMSDDASIQARYTKCGTASENAVNSMFSGKVYQSDRGNLFQMIQNNYEGTQYYASWSGNVVDDKTISGIWTDVEGNRGEFKLKR